MSKFSMKIWCGGFVSVCVCVGGGGGGGGGMCALVSQLYFSFLNILKI